MTFSLDSIERLFPPDISEQRKGRLRDGIKQFSVRSNSKVYTDFYLTSSPDYFLQGDLIFELRFPLWNPDKRDFEKVYFDSIILSNSCDIDDANQTTRTLPKQVMTAKLFSLPDFKEGLVQYDIENSDVIIQRLKNQEYSNLMYFPPINNIEYVAYFDELSSVSNEELNALKNDINKNRIACLDWFGYYLFMFKISYHFCRLPEEIDR
jgi:hypothetical protein